MEAKNVLAIVLAGGEGKRLKPLTNERSKPAVPFGGNYRMIDFVLSNFANAGYTKIVILTQYKSYSLDRHVSLTWRFPSMLDSYVTPVSAQMRRGPHWFSGSGDAIYQNLNLLADERPDIVCVFGADHIYRMDPRQMVEHHLEHAVGGVTVAAIPVAREQATGFGVIEADARGHIVRFHEKPRRPPTIPGRPDLALVSMGNYVFDVDVLTEAVTPDRLTATPRDIGSQIMPALVAAGRAVVYDFSSGDVPGQTESERGYWRDVGTLDSYYDANLDLVSAVPAFNLYNADWRLYTHSPPRPPAKLSHGVSGRLPAVADSLICAGAIVSGTSARDSIIGPDAYVDEASLEGAILLPGVRVHGGAELRRCVIDKNVVVPRGTRVGVDEEEDRARGFTISAAGVTVVNKGYVFDRPGQR